MRRLAIGRPSWVRRISGSLPRLPTRITLLTEPAMPCTPRFRRAATCVSGGALNSLPGAGRALHRVCIATAPHPSLRRAARPAPHGAGCPRISTARARCVFRLCSIGRPMSPLARAPRWRPDQGPVARSRLRRMDRRRDGVAGTAERRRGAGGAGCGRRRWQSRRHHRAGRGGGHRHAGAPARQRPSARASAWPSTSWPGRCRCAVRRRRRHVAAELRDTARRATPVAIEPSLQRAPHMSFVR